MDNKTHILNTAMELFERYGYDGTGVQAITEKAGLSKPTLYHWFGSKRELLKALIDSHLEKLLPDMESAAEYNHDLPFTLDKIAIVYFDFTISNPQFIRMFLTFFHGPPNSEAKKIANPQVSKLYQLLESLFVKASSDHGNMKNRSKILAAHFLGVLNTYTFLYLDGHLNIENTVRKEALRVFSYGIYS